MSDIRIPVQGSEHSHTGRPHEPAQPHPGPWDQLPQQPPPATGPPHQPFDTPNGRALPTFQRSSKEWYASTNQIPTTDAIKLVDRQAGRQWMLVSVAAAAPAGVVIDSAPESLFVAGAPNGFHVAKGGSISIPTEGPVWAVSDTPGTATQCDVAVGVNPQ